MAKPRMNLYGFPHKGIRNALAQLSLLAGNTNYSDEEELRILKALTSELAALLELHADIEDDIMLPALEARAPGSTTENIEEHIKLDKDVQAFHNQIKSITVNSEAGQGANFYTAVNHFYAQYIVHMAMEEFEINPIIWEKFTDEELFAMQGQIFAGFTPDQMMNMFKYIIPALNPFERKIMLGGFKIKASVDFFNNVMNMLTGYMPESSYKQLEAMLSQVE